MRSMTARAGMTGAVALTMLGTSLSVPAHASPDTPASPAEAPVLPAKVTANLTAALDAAGVRAVAGSTAATCGDTNFTVWQRQHTKGWTKADRKQAQTLLGLVEADALYYPQGPTRIGRNGEYTGAMQREMTRLRGFYDVDGRTVGLTGMHSSVLRSRTRLIRVLTGVGGASRRAAAAEATAIIHTVNQPKFEYGNHPMLTVNAFSSPGTTYKGRHVARRVVVGDGILQAMSDLGWRDTGAQEILAHEYGHQAEFANQLHTNTKASRTQYLELMADAYAGYFLHHPKGENHSWNTMNAYLRVAYATGDCAFTAVAHHGTPDQRMAAATWGARMVDSHRGQVLPTRRFGASFRGVYAGILEH